MMKSKRVTIKDIAKVMGVHHTTVSLAIRNSPLLKDETRKKIQAKAKQMNYKPNRLARGFRLRNSNCIAIMVPSIHHHFFSKFISEVTEFASKSGYSILILQSNDKLETEKLNIESLIENQVAGAIVSVSIETKNSRHFKIFEEEEVPLVFFDRIPNGYQGTTVSVDNYQLAYDAVDLMVKKGRKKIVFLVGAKHINVYKDRIKGYKDALKKNHLAIDENLIVDYGLKIMGGVKAMEKLMLSPEKPDGIIAVTSWLAIGALKYLKKIGYKIPEDISVISFDDDPVGMAVEPELTTCVQPVNILAKTSLDALLDQIERRDATRKKVIIKGDLVIRDSC